MIYYNIQKFILKWYNKVLGDNAMVGGLRGSDAAARLPNVSEAPEQTSEQDSTKVISGGTPFPVKITRHSSSSYSFSSTSLQSRETTKSSIAETALRSVLYRLSSRKRSEGYSTDSSTNSSRRSSTDSASGTSTPNLSRRSSTDSASGTSTPNLSRRSSTDSASRTSTPNLSRRSSTDSASGTSTPNLSRSSTDSVSGGDKTASAKEIQAFQKSVKTLDQDFEKEIESRKDDQDTVGKLEDLRRHLEPLGNIGKMSKQDLDTYKIELKRIGCSFTALKIEKLAEGAPYKIAQGKAKEVHKKIGDSTSAYFTPVKNNRAKQKEIEEEVAMAKALESKLKDEEREHHLALKLEVLEGDERINGMYTVKTDAASGDAEKLIRERSLEFPASLNLCLQFAKATSAFHQVDSNTGMGHIHGDIKPENALIYATKAGRVLRASDFGKTTQIRREQTKVHTGNPRFAPPEGGISMAGEVYSTHMVLVRFLESQFLDSDVGSMLIDRNQTGKTTGKEMDGYEKYMVNNKFTTQTNSLLGRVSSYASMLIGRSRSKMSTQFEESKAYIENLIDRMIVKYPTNTKPLEELQKLLLEMASSIHSKRPTAAVVVERLEAILQAIKT